MADGGDGGAGGGEGPLRFSKKDNSTAITLSRCILLGLAALAQVHFSTVSSQERPVKILTAPL